MQFEELLKEEQEAVEEFRRTINKMVHTDLSNVVYADNYACLIYHQKINDKINDISCLWDFYNRIEVFQFCLAFFANRFYNSEQPNKRIQNCFEFIEGLHFFIKVPEKKIHANSTNKLMQFQYVAA